MGIYKVTLEQKFLENKTVRKNFFIYGEKNLEKLDVLWNRNPEIVSKKVKKL